MSEKVGYIPKAVYYDPPAWYKNNIMFKPIKDWTYEELALEHAIVKQRMALNSGPNPSMILQEVK